MQATRILQVSSATAIRHSKRDPIFGNGIRPVMAIASSQEDPLTSSACHPSISGNHLAVPCNCGNYIFSTQLTSESKIFMISGTDTKASDTKNTPSTEALRIIEAAKCQDEVQGAVARRPTSNYMGF